MPDTLDVLTLDEAKDGINFDASTDTHDDELGRIVTAVSRRLDDACGPIVARERTELHDGGDPFIRPRKTPVSAVTTLKEYVDTTATTLTEETNASKPADGYLLDDVSTHNVKIIRRSGNSDHRFPSGRRNVELVYDAGRAENTAAVDPVFKQAAALILSHIWKPNAGAWASNIDPFEGHDQIPPGVAWKLPPSALDLLDDELLPPGVA